MLPIVKALKDRLLHEPAFVISAIAALYAYGSVQWELPAWATGLGVVVGGIATRAVVTPAAEALEARRRAAAAARGSRGAIDLWTVLIVLAIVVLVLVIIALVDVDVRG